MSEQLQLRRGSAAQVAAFTGAQGEVAVDTTNNRLVVQDGSTAGGWPQALATRTAVADAAYTVLVTDRQIAYTALTAARIVTLPAAASYPLGAKLEIFDESGACSPGKTITVSRAGSDTISGSPGSTTSLALSGPNSAVALESNGVGQWTILHSRLVGAARTAVSDAAYAAVVTDRLIAYTAITASRAVTLPAAAAFPAGTPLTIIDESGAVTATNTIVVARAGSDTINGAASFAIGAAYGFAALESNGSNAWTLISGSVFITSVVTPGPVGVGTASPAATLDVQTTWPGNSPSHLSGSWTSYGDVSRFVIRGANGSQASPSGTTSGQSVGNINFRGYTSAGAFTAGVVNIQPVAEENYSGTSCATGLSLGTTPSGSVSWTARAYIGGNGNFGINTTTPATTLDVNGLVRTGGYTVATLPAASSTIKGARAYVTDAAAPTFLGALTGSGSVVCPVFCNGSAWVAG